MTCGGVCPECGHCCANIVAPYLDLTVTVAYKVRCQQCDAVYVQKA